MSLKQRFPFDFTLSQPQDIIRLPRLFRFLQRPLAKLISTFRAPKSKEAYASIGGGSPLRKITNEQANALKLALQKKNLHADIYMLECGIGTLSRRKPLIRSRRIRLQSLLFFHCTLSTPYQQAGQASVFSRTLSMKIHILLPYQFPL